MNETLISSLLERKQEFTLVAITKYVPSEVIRKLYSLGVRDFGESKAKELIGKKEELKDLSDIRWHFIGHLQRNKAKKIAPLIHVLHSLDSLELASMLDRDRAEPLDVFIEIKLSEKESKHGIAASDLEPFLVSMKQYQNLHVRGIMAMADDEMSEEETEKLFAQAEEIRNRYHFPSLSMGMSNDYEIALRHSSTHIRLGRILFDRNEAKEDYRHYFDV